MNAKMKLSTLTTILFFGTYFTFAQLKLDVSVSKSNLKIGETAQVDFIFNANGQNFEPPRFGNFEVGGPFVSASENLVNGAYSASQQYSYVLQATKAGKYVIPSASISYKGKSYYSKPIQLVVTNQKIKESKENEYFTGNQTPKNKTTTSKNQAVFVEAELDKKETYINAPVEVTYRIYLNPKFRIQQENKINYPKFNNFWSQIEDTDEGNWYEVYVNGRQYFSKVFRKALLYPQKTGTLVINPVTLDLNIAFPTGEFDFFDDPIFDTTRKIIVSNTLKINVKPLPENGKPKIFTGAVGDFDFQVIVDKNDGKTGESFEMALIVSGKGNLKLFDIPKPIFPKNIEVFEPKHSENITENKYGMSGKITDVYTFIPTEKGVLRIPKQFFTFFNSQTKRYQTIATPEQTINVDQGTDSVVSHSNVKTSTSVVKDFSEAANTSTKAYNYLFGLTIFLIALVVLVWVLRIKNKNQIQVSEPVEENVETTVEEPKFQREQLQEQDAWDKEKLYPKIERILQVAFMEKFNFKSNFIDKTALQQYLQEAAFTKEFIDDTLKLLDTCEQVKFAPFIAVNCQADFDLAQKILSELARKN